MRERQIDAQITATLKREQFEDVERIARSRNVSRSTIVREALDRELRRYRRRVRRTNG